MCYINFLILFAHSQCKCHLVFGNWGSGKSSLMLLLQQSLQEWEKSQQNEYHRIKLQVYFNSWQFESYDSTKLTMIESILEALDKDINERKDVFERMDDFLERINFLKAGVFILKKAYENLTPDWLKKWLPTKEDLDKITDKDKYNNSFRITSIQIINIDNNCLIAHIINQLFKEFSERCDKF